MSGSVALDCCREHVLDVQDVIRSGSESVHAAEVEAVLAQHPAVKAAAVVGLPHSRWGEQVSRLPHAGAQLLMRRAPAPHMLRCIPFVPNTTAGISNRHSFSVVDTTSPRHTRLCSTADTADSSLFGEACMHTALMRFSCTCGMRMVMHVAGVCTFEPAQQYNMGRAR